MTIQISKLIEEVAEDKILTFPLRLDGQAYAQTEKRNARLSISVPSNVIGKNLMDKDKWWWRVIVIEKKEYERAYKKLEGQTNEIPKHIRKPN